MSPIGNQDYHDILAALISRDARFLIVGAHALAAHGYPRATVDIDIWIDRTPANVRRVWQALADFGARLDDLGIREEDLTRPDIVAQFGLPPNRIDILTDVSGLTFDAAWPSRIEEELEGVRVPVLGIAELKENKRDWSRQGPRRLKRAGGKELSSWAKHASISSSASLMREIRNPTARSSNTGERSRLSGRPIPSSIRAVHGFRRESPRCPTLGRSPGVERTARVSAVEIGARRRRA